jgi:hypothetical protein
MYVKAGDFMRFKKGDIIILLIIAAAGILWFAINQIGKAEGGKQIVIEVNAEIYKVISMEEGMQKQDIHIDLGKGKHIDITADKNGVYVKDVVCPDRICQKTGIINNAGQSIVCLPNRVVIYIDGESEDFVDVVSY